ncbi:MAG TPA: tryptophan--tRNA ligase [Terracidiphilus sp.]|nr:tryptophan--tRNA ligase [Terracidiphilus sp.]
MPETAISSSRPRVLSGMRPTGKLHLGNFMGALANWVKLQDRYECYFFIADWHALTTDYADPGKLQQKTLDVVLDWLAAGLDPKKSTIFIQSHVRQHAELHLLFSMMTPLGWLERVPTYKEQLENLKGKDLSTYGFLGYPLLQAADILVYRADYVPVGQDQVAHVELTREVARRFNSMYRTQIFPEPEALLTPSPRLAGTDGRKMSKSYGNTIGLSEPPAVVAHKVLSMSTGGQRIRQTDPGDPDFCPVGDLHKAFSSPEVLAETQEGCRTATIRCEFCKIQASHSVCSVTEPIYYERLKLESKIEDTWQRLRHDSVEKAAKKAEETMTSVRTIFDLSHDLGSVRRHFLLTPEEKRDLRDLSSHPDWWDLAPSERSRLLRDYWRSNLVPYDIQLSQESNRVFTTAERELEEPFLTSKKKRVFVTTSRDILQPDKWDFEIPAKTYEIWTLLCWRAQDRMLRDFAIPQKLFSFDFSLAKRSSKKKDKIPVTILRTEGNRFLLSIAGTVGQDVTAFEGDYEPLR